ncbi:MAG: hypothetical protein DRN59_03875 [Thaumarchaeota archaeon]|nr:MAG: hypothetical protein DRN59_03875 [Nitrososphaerota archaeon]
MLDKIQSNPLIFLGAILIILGIILILLPTLSKLGLRLEEIHPLLLLGKRFDGVYIGTSPLLIIILIALYLLILFLRRG